MFLIFNTPQYYFFNKGKMFHYQGPTDVESLEGFALEDWQFVDESKFKIIPTQVDFLKVSVGFVKNEFRKVIKIYTASKLRGFVLIGFIVTASYLSCRIGTWLGSKVLGDPKKNFKNRKRSYRE